MHTVAVSLGNSHAHKQRQRLDNSEPVVHNSEPPVMFGAVASRQLLGRVLGWLLAVGFAVASITPLCFSVPVPENVSGTLGAGAGAGAKGARAGAWGAGCLAALPGVRCHAC